MEFTFRSAKKQDSEKIFDLIKVQAQSERKNPDEVHLTKDKIEAHGFGKHKYFHVLLAEYKKNPVAYALYFFSYSTQSAAPVLYLEDIFVDEIYRNHGLGTALLTNLARIALEKECCRMEGHAFTWNKRIIDFYEFFGGHSKTDVLHYRLSEEDFLKLVK